MSDYSSRNPESNYGRDDDDINHDRMESHNEFTPTKKKTSSVYSTLPTGHSQSGSRTSFSSRTRDAFNEHYFKMYRKGCYCILTLQDDTNLLRMAHVIRRNSPREMASGIEVHHSFDQKYWFFLPDIHVLQDVHDYVKTIISWRESTSSSKAPLSFLTKWKLEKLTQYTLVAVIYTPPISRIEPGQSPITHTYPFPDFPTLACHIAPPFAVINAGPKCNRDKIGEIVQGRFPQPTDESKKFERRLTLLCDTWDLFQGAMSAAQAWGIQCNREQRARERKRKEADSDQIPMRITRSKSRLNLTGTPSFNALNPQAPRRPTSYPPGHLKRNLSSTSDRLTCQALARHGKRPKIGTCGYDGSWSRSAIADWAKDSSRASSLLNSDVLG
ncbi:uncharacterized protein EDB93DRAFT_1256293 [Suillus bovinus]|uniref:uncharacterized protein n=1 Tax=Suillus bovinus TaxID=48563 RepID=UPI001B87B03E|nr:uncharacterized protein EDB93DRAFT_1256293 [Suillus bovinus]KAG2129423.1 hypothetical protein EDB93DRAFT_1256293 [Suillus bovinus]